MKYNPYIQSDFESGGIENLDNLTKEDALLREILEERYITFYGQIEGFNDVRRTRKELHGIKLMPNSGDKLPGDFYTHSLRLMPIQILPIHLLVSFSQKDLINEVLQFFNFLIIFFQWFFTRTCLK